MKYLVKGIFALLAIGVMTVSCKKDEDEPTPKNQMTVDGIEYLLSQGVLENYGQPQADDAYNFDLTLLSSDFTLYEVNGEIDSVSGTGEAIFFELYTSNSSALEPGEYVYTETATDDPGTFHYAGGAINYNTETQTGTEFDIIDGIVTVKKKWKRIRNFIQL